MTGDRPLAAISIHGTHFDQMNAEDLNNAWPYLSLTVRRGESRGSSQEVLLFLLQTDWQVVRDTLVAGAIARGALDARTAIVWAARRIAGSVAKSVPGGDAGTVVLEDQRSRVHLEISSEAAQSEAPWLALFELEAKGSMVWDEANGEWKSEQ